MVCFSTKSRNSSKLPAETRGWVVMVMVMVIVMVIVMVMVMGMAMAMGMAMGMAIPSCRFLLLNRLSACIAEGSIFCRIACIGFCSDLIIFVVSFAALSRLAISI